MGGRREDEEGGLEERKGELQGRERSSEGGWEEGRQGWKEGGGRREGEEGREGGRERGRKGGSLSQWVGHLLYLLGKGHVHRERLVLLLQLIELLHVVADL